MKLNQNSISARLYRWFYLTEDMPTNLCPYFWKLVVMYILLIPVGIITLPTIFSKRIHYGDFNFTERLIVSFVSWALMFFVFIAIFPITYLFVGWFPKDTTFNAWQIIGLGLWIGVIIGCLITLPIYLYKRRKEKHQQRYKKSIWNEEFGDYVDNPDYVPYESKPNILIEFIKAKYNKYCPKIDWN